MDRNSEYEIQHYGFSVTQISMERKYILQTFLSSNLEALTAKLVALPLHRKLDEEKQKVQERIWQSFAQPLSALEALDEKLFAIPPHVLLPIDFELAKRYSEQDEKRVDEELATIMKAFRENAVMKAALKSENAMYDSLDAYMQDELDFCRDAQQELCSAKLESWRELVDVTKTIAASSAAAETDHIAKPTLAVTKTVPKTTATPCANRDLATTP